MMQASKERFNELVSRYPKESTAFKREGLEERESSNLFGKEGLPGRGRFSPNRCELELAFCGASCGRQSVYQCRSSHR